MPADNRRSTAAHNMRIHTTSCSLAARIALYVALSAALMLILSVTDGGSGFVAGSSVDAEFVYLPIVTGSQLGSVVDAVRFGVAKTAEIQRSAPPGSRVTVTVRLGGNGTAPASTPELVWSDGAFDVTETSVDLGVSSSVLIVDGTGLAVDCGTVTAGGAGVLRVRMGTLAITNLTVRACRGSAQAGTATAVQPCILSVDAPAAATWSLFHLESFVGVRFACVAGIFNASDGYLTHFTGMGGPSLVELTGAAVTAVARLSIAHVTAGTDRIYLGIIASLTDDSTLHMSDCDIEGISAGVAGAGGVMSVSGRSVVVLYNVAARSVAVRSGGLASIFDNAHFACNGCDLVNMSAVYSGGTFDIRGTAVVNLSNSAVTASMCGGTGGFAVMSDGPTLSMSNVTVTDAVAAGAGGVVSATSVFGSGGLFVTNCTFRRCVSGVIGGVVTIYGDSAFVAVLTHVTVVMVTAPYAPVIHIDGLTVLNLTSSTIVDVHAYIFGGVSIVFGAATLNMVDVSVTDTDAISGGGFIYATGNAMVTLDGCRVMRSSTDNNGGALYLTSSSHVYIHNSSFVSVVAAYDGGFAALDTFASLWLDNCDISNASAVLGGGFIAKGQGSIVASHISMRRIRSSGDGAVVYASESSTVRISGANIVDSAAGEEDVLGAASQSLTRGGSGHLGSLNVANGGAFSANVAAFVVLEDVSAVRTTASGAGGFIAALGKVTVSVSNSSTAGSLAFVGGGILAAFGATISISQMHISNTSAATDGGCMYFGRGSLVKINTTSVENCHAGLVRASFGAGGGAYIDDAVQLTITSPLRAHGVSAVLGSGVYSVASLGASTASRILVESGIAINASEIPADWSVGGLLSGSIERLVPSLSSISSRSGAALPPFTVGIRDIFGGSPSLPSSLSLAIRLYVQFDDTQTQSKFLGDTERNFATASSVLFSGLRLFAQPGNYILRAESANPFLYGSLDPSPLRRSIVSNFSFPIAVTDCDPLTEELIVFAVDGNANETAWQCRSLPVGAPAVTSNDYASLVKVVVPSVVLGISALACFATVVRWRLVVRRRENSRLAQAEFVQKQADMLVGLSALEIPRAQVEVLERIGEGEFGVVMKARVIMADGRPRLCAAKTLKEGASYEERVAFVGEAQILAGISHPNVISLCGCLTTEEPLFLLFEYAPHGDLRSFVMQVPVSRRSAPSTQAMLVNFAAQIARGMAFVSAIGIVHRDLAARNCLVSQDVFGEYVIKVADFGLSKEILQTSDYYRSKRSRKERLPYRWMSIDALETRRFSTKCDVWSFGIVVWEMFSFGAVPYGATVSAVNILSHLRAGNRLDCPAPCPADLFQALVDCWNGDSDQRPLFAELAERVAMIRVSASHTGSSQPLSNGRRHSLAAAAPSATVIGPSLPVHFGDRYSPSVTRAAVAQPTDSDVQRQGVAASISEPSKLAVNHVTETNYLEVVGGEREAEDLERMESIELHLYEAAVGEC